MDDKYVQKAYAAVTLSAANTLTFSEINTGLAMFEKVAWIIHRIQWFLASATIQELVANDDYIQCALVGSDKMTSFGLDDQAVYDLFAIDAMVSGTPASGLLIVQPFVRDFSNLPGKGIIVPPRPLYVACTSAGFTVAASINVRIEFTYVKLKADEYWELVEATRIIE